MQQNITEAEDLLPFAVAIAQHWQPIKTWTQIALLLSQNGAYLATTTSTLLTAIIVLYYFETRKRRKANTKAYQKLSKPSRQMIGTVLETEKTATPTLAAIAATYKNRTGEPIEERKLLQRLTEAEKTGIIKSAITSIQDEPTRIWKTQISRKGL